MNPYAIIGGLVLAIAAFFTGMHVGTGMEQAAWQKEKLVLAGQAREQVLAEVNKRDADRLRAESNARKASQNYEDGLKAKDEKYAAGIADQRRLGGLRIPASACTSGLAASGRETPGASGLDEVGASTVELPQRTQERLYDLTSRADSLAEQLRALQGWIISNGFYGEAPDGIRRPD